MNISQLETSQEILWKVTMVYVSEERGGFEDTARDGVPMIVTALCAMWRTLGLILPLTDN